MVSQTQPKLPQIDFTKQQDLKPGTSTWIAICKEVKCALENFGCFVAVYDKVSSELYNDIFSSAQELFDLPRETKTQNTYDKPFFGYVGPSPLIPLYEGMGIDEAPTLEEVQTFTNLMWPAAGNDHFCKTVHSYSVLVSELDQMVKRMVFESYGVEKYYDSFVGSTDYLLRFMKYRGPEMEESNVGVTNHTDKTFLTILHQNQVNGLQVKTKDGHWIGFQPSSPSSSFVVMAGDAFLAWSNNRVHSPNHRVIMNGKEASRYSIGLFAFQKEMIHVPQELVDDEHPLQFKPFDNFGLLGFYYAHMESQNECAAKTYCGV